MRKWIVWLLMAALLTAPITTLAKELDSELFKSAKQALTLISYGEYKKALKKMGFSSGKEDAKKLQSLAEDQLPSALYGEVQTEVAVAYETSKGFKLAVPVESPAGGNVEALVMLSPDGKSFGGYRAMNWDDVMDEVDQSENVIWKDAYKPAKKVIVADE